MRFFTRGLNHGKRKTITGTCATEHDHDAKQTPSSPRGPLCSEINDIKNKHIKPLQYQQKKKTIIQRHGAVPDSACDGWDGDQTLRLNGPHCARTPVPGLRHPATPLGGSAGRPAGCRRGQPPGRGGIGRGEGTRPTRRSGGRRVYV